MSNEEMVARIQSGEDRDGEIMAALWEQNWNYVASIAQRYTGLAEFDDLLQEGFIGLNDAVLHWRSKYEKKFMNYAAYWIRSYMLRFTDKNSAFYEERSMRQKVRDLRKTRTEYEREFGREPTEAETCHLLEVTKKELESIELAAAAREAVSLDSLADAESDASLGDLTPSGEDLEAAVLDQVQQEELSRVLWEVVDGLPENMPIVLRERYQEEKTLKEIGEEIGCTMQQASAIYQKALTLLRRPTRKSKLQPFADEYIRSRAMQGTGISSFNRTWTSSTEREAIKDLEREEEKNMT